MQEVINATWMGKSEILTAGIPIVSFPDDRKEEVNFHRLIRELFVRSMPRWTRQDCP